VPSRHTEVHTGNQTQKLLFMFIIIN
jgi:hypothetical protein